MSIHHGIVKEIRSGDTVVVFGPPNQVAAPEYSITLSGIIAPRLGRKDGIDEPFAWAAREFLRTRYIGKKVSFRVDSEFNGREFGTVFDNGESIALGLVAAGLVRVKDKGQGSEHEDMLALQQEAIAAGRGLHGGNTSMVRDVVDQDFDLEEFYEMNKGRALHGIVERVRDGGVIQAYVMPEFQYVNLFLSGVSAPRAPRNAETNEIEPQPFYYEAKYLVESLALQRDILFYIDQVQNGMCYASVLLQQGSIAEELLRRGLAKTVEWSLDLSVCKTGMRIAERAAREALLGIWKDYVPSANSCRKVQGDNSFQARVIEIRSGDKLVIQKAGTHEHTQVKLASIRCPRPATRDQEAEDWAHEAKELLRSALIGQQVLVKMDYMRLVGEADMAHVTIMHRGKNMSVELAKAGLCETMRHRGDEDRAAAYDEIAEAESEAQGKKIRMHGTGGAPARRYNDQSVNAQKAKNFLPRLQRQGRVSGVVDFVIGATRVKITLPEDGAVIVFGLSGIRCPSATRQSEPGQEYGDEALEFTRLHIMQRDVQLEVEQCDRGGAFMGTLWMNGQSLAVNLLRNGYAWCSDTVDRSPYNQQLLSAENEAKTAKKRVWVSYDEEEARRAAEERREAALKAEPTIVNVEVRHVVNGNTFFARLSGAAAENLTQARKPQFAQGDFGAPSSGNRYRVNQYCSAEFSDGKMYRAKVLGHDEGWYEVQFIDFGNNHWVQDDKMQPWDASSPHMNQPPQAFECKLAYVRAPSLDDDYGNDAGAWLGENIMGKNLTAQIVAKSDREVYHLMLFEGDNTTVNSDILRSGYTMLTKDAKRNPNPSKELKGMLDSVEHAKRSRINLWRYGDPESDDEDTPRRAWGR
jgi:staphylococcal nuclease domain-containing protein 1